MLGHLSSIFQDYSPKNKNMIFPTPVDAPRRELFICGLGFVVVLLAPIPEMKAQTNEKSFNYATVPTHENTQFRKFQVPIMCHVRFKRLALFLFLHSRVSDILSSRHSVLCETELILG